MITVKSCRFIMIMSFITMERCEVNFRSQTGVLANRSLITRIAFFHT